VTGGAGFIGSHMVDKLVELGCDVTVYDDLRTGQEKFLEDSRDKVELVKADVLDLERLRGAMKGRDFVFHFAANADVRGGVRDTRVDLDQNLIGTWNVLEAMRENGIKKIAFSSTSAIYGDPEVFPTPEDYKPIQTSMYGASKLAGEAYIEAYCEAFGLQAWIFRFVSFVGDRYTHGAIFDFVKKLREDPKKMEILGDGSQKKSYLYVKDGVEAMITAVSKADEKVNYYNLGNKEYLDVIKLADIVVEELGLKGVEYEYTGGKKGWVGDSPFVQLAVDKICGLGWEPTVSIEEGIRKTVQYLKENEFLLGRE